MIYVKRVYDKSAVEQGQRFLVDRLWPRGIKKEDLPLEAWLKDVAPSADLRRWYHQNHEQWQEFQRRYQAELDSRPDTLQPLLKAARQGDITLLYSTHEDNAEHSNAAYLKSYLEKKLGRA